MSYMRAIRSSDFTTNEKITALMIASHFDFSKGDPVWASNKTLAKEAGLSIRSVIRAKKVLTDSHYLTSHRQYNNVCLLYPTLPESQPLGTSGTLNTHINTHINTNRNTQINKKDSNESLHVINSYLNQGGTTSFGTNERPFEYERTAAAGPAGRGDSLPAESMRHAGRDDSADARESEANQKLVRAFQSDWLD